MSRRIKPGACEAPAQWEDWLAVSTDGFASMNAGRDPAHLVKELVQNALDALDDAGGDVILTMQGGTNRQSTLITCRDTGCGMKDLSQIRTVFFTSKTDSYMKRGRMGRGFKELLCLANWANVTSAGRCINFVKEGGKRVTRESAAPQTGGGTLVKMEMPWPAEMIERLEDYFQMFLPPPGVRLEVNGTVISPTEREHRIDTTLPTELFEDGKWIRPLRRTMIQLVPVMPSEEPTVYELGIPVCSAEWTQAFHIDVCQRVPMNPCRDAAASGYLVKLHRACLPTLLKEMDSDQVRQDWVGNAVPHCDEGVQKDVILMGFGQNIARSVPKMGARQFDEDAREIGVEVIDTKQTSGGFRQILQDHVPTTRAVVDQHNRELVSAAAAGSFTIADATGEDHSARKRKQLIEAAGGPERVQKVMEFARWFCQKLLEGYEDSSVCSVTLALLKPVNAIATWSSDDVLTLGIDTAFVWSDPLGEETLSLLVHETGHSRNQHHGRDFHQELEALAGRAARVMFEHAGFVRQHYGEFV